MSSKTLHDLKPVRGTSQLQGDELRPRCKSQTFMNRVTLCGTDRASGALA